MLRKLLNLTLFKRKIYMEKLKIETTDKTIKVLIITFCILLVIPSIIYLVSGNDLEQFKCNYKLIFNFNDSITFNEVLFCGIFVLFCILYIIIIKNYKKIFKDNKELLKYIIIISILFTLILPITSTDVFYYISTGWSEANYGINPYYTSVYDLKQNNNIDDELLNIIPKVWENQKIVYGPIWPLICKILSLFSFGNVIYALVIFKIFNLSIHLLNYILIEKITNNKKVLGIIYALNPLILYQGLSAVHNDIFLIFFILLAIYFAIKKKNIILSVISLAIATAIKYVAILIVPFLVIYYFRKEKVLKRILNAIWLAIIFLVTLCGIYLIYTRDFQVLQGIFDQQNKYSNSLLLIIFLIVRNTNKMNIILNFVIGSFLIYYLVNVFIVLFKRKVTLFKTINYSYITILIFVFFTLTNFQVWYIIWLIPFILFQNSKRIKSIISLTISAQLVHIIGYMFNLKETLFCIVIIILWQIFNKININRFIILKNKKEMVNWKD